MSHRSQAEGGAEAARGVGQQAPVEVHAPESHVICSINNKP